MANRATKVLGIFAEDANTVIPVTPIDGTAYRDATIAAAIAKGGWPFNTIVDSKNFNQILYNYSQLLNGLDKRGILPYSTDVDYDDLPAIAWGSDGIAYKALIANGPATTVVDPVGDVTGTWVSFLAIARGMFSTTVNVAASGALSAANVNKLHKFNTAAAAMTLPTLVGLSPGDTFTCVSHFNKEVSFTPDGANVLAGVNGSTTVAVLEPYSCLTFTVSATANTWDVGFFKGNKERRVLTAGSITGSVSNLPFVLSTLDPVQSLYNRYELWVRGFQPATTDKMVYGLVSDDAGASYANTLYDSIIGGNIANDNSGGATRTKSQQAQAQGVILGGDGANDALSNAANLTATMVLDITNMNTGQSRFPYVSLIRGLYYGDSGNLYHMGGGMSRKSASDYDALKLTLESGGNFANVGSYVLYKVDGPFL